MTELVRRRRLLALGQRAVDYYVDTGLCVFCDADDVFWRPHDGCDVGTASGVVVDDERRKRKAEQRGMVLSFLEKLR